MEQVIISKTVLCFNQYYEPYYEPYYDNESYY